MKFLICLIFAFLLNTYVPNALAADFGTSSSGKTALSVIGQLCQEDLMDPNTKEIKIFSVGVKCFETITAGLAEHTIQDFSSYLAHIVYIVLVLYVIFFGMKVASGLSEGGRLRGEAFMTALKFAFVGFLVFGYSQGFGFTVDLTGGGLNIGGSQPGLLTIYGLVISSYHSILTVVMPTNGFGECSSGYTFGGQGTQAIWESMDCLFSKFIGWNAQDGYGTGTGVSDKGGIAMIFAYISTKALPANGFFIGGLLFSTLMTLMMSFFRLAFIYILAMIALIMLFSIGPLMIPLMLFQRTKEYFDGWVRLIIGVILQPIILFAFFSFIGGILANTVKDLEKLFKDMKITYETSGYTQTGDQQNLNQTTVVNSISNAIDKMDKEMVLNGVIILVVAYLLVSFINFVGEMAAELAGSRQLNLQHFSPKFAGGGGGGG